MQSGVTLLMSWQLPSTPEMVAFQWCCMSGVCEVFLDLLRWKALYSHKWSSLYLTKYTVYLGKLFVITLTILELHFPHFFLYFFCYTDWFPLVCCYFSLWRLRDEVNKTWWLFWWDLLRSMEICSWPTVYWEAPNLLCVKHVSLEMEIEWGECWLWWYERRIIFTVGRYSLEHLSRYRTKSKMIGL